MRRTELSAIELKRHEVLSRVERKKLKLREAAELTGVSYAQAKRLRWRHREAGAIASRQPLRHCQGCEFSQGSLPLAALESNVRRRPD